MPDQAKALIFTVEIDAKTGQLQLKQFGDTAEQAFKQTSQASGRAARDVGNAADTMSSDMKQLGGLLRSLSTAGQFAALTGAIYSVDRAMRSLERVSNLSLGFETLTRRVGETSTEMLDRLRPATLGLVSDLDLMQQTNAAIILGLPVTADKMAELAEIATKLGRAMGVDAKTSLESLIIGIGRQSRLWLDNIGIIVDADKAYSDFARTLGKTADQLTETEKKQAFFDATLKQGKVAARNLADEGIRLSDVWMKAMTALWNHTRRVAEEINNTFNQAYQHRKRMEQFAPTVPGFEGSKIRMHELVDTADPLQESTAAFNQYAVDRALASLGDFTNEIERQVELRSVQLGLIKRDDDLAAKKFDKEHGITLELERQAAIRRNGAMQIGTQVSTGISDVRSAMQFRQGGGAMGAYESMVGRWDADFAKSAKDAQDVADAYRNVGREYSAAAKQLFEYRDAILNTEAVSRFLMETQAALGYEFATFEEQNREAIDALLERSENLENFVQVTEMLAGAFGQLGGSMLAAAVSGDRTAGMFRGVMKSLASSAYAQSLYELAMGIAASTPWGLAIYGPPEPHYRSSAIFAAVGTAAGAVARVSGSGGGGGHQVGSSNTSAPDRAVPAAGGRPIQIQINIEHALGDLDELARRIGEEVEHAARKSGQA